MTTLGIDIETYSDYDIRLGVYKYAESPFFRILLFAYQIDDAPVEVIDLTKDPLPGHVLALLKDDTVIKTAFNAQFERVCLDKTFGLETKNWHCTMIRAWTLGFTGGLDAVSKALGVPQDEGKIKDGKRLIRLFSKPQRLTKARPSTKPYTREERPEDWARFIEYCRRDVEVEAFIRKKLSRYPATLDVEQTLYALDQTINDRGVRVDLAMAKNAIQINQTLTAKYTERFQEITGIPSPNQLGALKEWLGERAGGPVEAVTKKNREDLFDLFKDDPEALEALTCRYKTGKTSTAKYQKMIDAAGEDDRIRGVLQFYGAQTTGRWAGRLIQVQNLPQNHIADLDTARQVIKEADYETLALAYENPPDILSQCIRPAIIPSEGKKFVVSDYSAIEARVIAWLAGEDWVLDVFKTTGKIYEATAARMLGVPVEAIKKPSPERQKGKIATLALGYQGGVGSMRAMGALKMGIAEEELQGIVDQWRGSHPKTVAFWGQAEEAFIRVTEDQTGQPIGDYVQAFYDHGILFLRLPSGRLLAYPRPRVQIGATPWGEAKKAAYGVVTSSGDWVWRDTYGGKIVENIVQATARDCLAYAMLRLEAKGYPIVMHIHDEVVIEVDQEDDQAMKEIVQIMGEPLPWAPGLPLTADAYECPYYKKD